MMLHLSSSMLVAIAIAGVASTATLFAQQTPAPAGHQPANQPAAKGDAEPRPGLSVAVSADGQLTISASRMALGVTLREISTKARLPIMVDDTLSKDLITSFRARGVSLEEGLKNLLAGYDVFYLFSANDESAGSVKAVWVYARGQGHSLEPVPAALWASTQELQRYLEDPNPEVRAETYESLIEREGVRGLDTVLKALIDPDPDVRARALSSAIDADVEIPAPALESIVLDVGQTQSMRVLALQAIQGRPEAEAIATTVANDPDDAVRYTAQRILAARRPPR